MYPCTIRNARAPTPLHQVGINQFITKKSLKIVFSLSTERSDNETEDRQQSIRQGFPCMRPVQVQKKERRARRQCWNAKRDCGTQTPLFGCSVLLLWRRQPPVFIAQISTISRLACSSSSTGKYYPSTYILSPRVTVHESSTHANAFGDVAC